MFCLCHLINCAFVPALQNNEKPVMQTKPASEFAPGFFKSTRQPVATRVVSAVIILDGTLTQSVSKWWLRLSVIWCDVDMRLYWWCQMESALSDE